MKAICPDIPTSWNTRGGVSQNLSSVTSDSLSYKLLKSLLLIGNQQICHWFLSFVIGKRLCETGPWFLHHPDFTYCVLLPNHKAWIHIDTAQTKETKEWVLRKVVHLYLGYLFSSHRLLTLLWKQWTDVDNDMCDLVHIPMYNMIN